MAVSLGEVSFFSILRNPLAKSLGDMTFRVPYMMPSTAIQPSLFRNRCKCKQAVSAYDTILGVLLPGGELLIIKEIDKKAFLNMD